MNSRPAPHALGSVLAGKYRLDAVLGQGGMGAVYRAENVDLGRAVAIKVLYADLARDEALLHRFRQEARAAASIGHPGIVDVLDLGTTDEGDAFIVMERLDGETVGARLERLGQLTVRETCELCAAALDALAAAHARGIIHRDLKPENLFLVARPVPGVKLLDFGISKLQGADDVSLTRTGSVLGTPLYMSPEQARGARDVGTATDLWSVGAIVFHLLAGRPPFEGETYNELIAKLITEEPPAIASLRRGLPPRLLALLDRLLDKDPGARPDAAAARDALRAVLAELREAPVALDETIAPDTMPDARIAPAALSETALAASAVPVPAATTPDVRPPAAAAAVVRRSRQAAIVVGLVALAIGVAAVVWMQTRSHEGAGAPPPPPAPDARAPAIAIDAGVVVVDAAPVSLDAPPAPPPDAGPRGHKPKPRAIDAGAGKGTGDLGIDENNPLRGP